VEAALGSQDAAVRLSAARALGVLGDATTVGPLLACVVAGPDGDEAAAARESLSRLRGPGVDAALAARLAPGDAAAKTEILRILAARQAVETVPAIGELAADSAEAVRKEAWKALGALARAGDAERLLNLLSRAGEPERDEAEKAVTAVLRGRGGVEALWPWLGKDMSPLARASFVRVAGNLGDERALEAVRQAVGAADAPVRDAAVRALAAWPTPTPVEDLVALAGHAQDPVHRILALRGAIRLAGQAKGRSPEQMARLVGELMGLARETAERKAVLAELGRCPAPEALALAQTYLPDPELATEAGVAVTQVAAAIQEVHRDLVLAALAPLVKASLDPAVTARAGKVLREMLKPTNLALGAVATSPDGTEPDGASGGDAAAVDGNPRSYWDETDNWHEYRLRVTFGEAQEVVALNLLWHPYEQHQAKNLDVLCDGVLASQVRDRRCLDHEMFVLLAEARRCTSIELVIPGRNGLVSPAIHELQVFGRDILPPGAPQ
jgi:HEAT repeat protein